MMTLINAIYDHGSLTADELGIFVRLLCPFAPHISEEIWESLGNKTLCSIAQWPEYDESKTVDATVEYAVQVLGKLRGTVIVNATDDKDTVIAKAKAVDKVIPFLEGKTIVKEIVVPGRLVNFVVR
jgi:leucyl-tRNA synthetase